MGSDPRPPPGAVAASEPAEAWLDRADDRLLEAWDEMMAGAYRRGGAHLACHAGCDECCIGPFGIHALDARRLRRGLRALEAAAPEHAEAIRQRARAAVERLRPGFPGESRRGVLTGDDPEAEDRYLDRHADLPCPVLDPERRTCQLYSYRPLSCRAYGPPLSLGEGPLDPCRLCFTTAGPEEIEACRVDPDPEGLEETVLDAVERATSDPLGGETLIAFALFDTTAASS